MLFSPMLSYLHLRIDAAQKEIPFVLDKTVYKKLITRAVLLNLTNLLWQTVYLIPIVIVCSVPLIGWFTPIFTILMECYFLGYSMLDYGLATEKKNKIASATHIFVSGNSLTVCSGIHALETTPEKYATGTDLVVIGTTFENNTNFYKL